MFMPHHPTLFYFFLYHTPAVKSSLREVVPFGRPCDLPCYLHLFKRIKSFSPVPWGTREQTSSNTCERFWTCGPLRIDCKTDRQAPWMKEESPVF